ncbi:hypothetical protein RB200_09295 [Streptomyces sp. PmtG]
MPPRLRSVLSAVAIVLACLLVAPGTVATWATYEIEDTDRYVATMAPLSSDPAVRSAVAAAVTDSVVKEIDAGPLQSAVESFVRAAVRSFTETPAFRTAWNAANRAAHAAVEEALRNDSDSGVTIDLAPYHRAGQTAARRRGRAVRRPHPRAPHHRHGDEGAGPERLPEGVPHASGRGPVAARRRRGPRRRRHPARRPPRARRRPHRPRHGARRRRPVRRPRRGARPHARRPAAGRLPGRRGRRLRRPHREPAHGGVGAARGGPRRGARRLGRAVAAGARGAPKLSRWPARLSGRIPGSAPHGGHPADERPHPWSP